MIFQKSSTDEQGVIQFKAPCLSSQMIAVAEARRQGLIEFEKKACYPNFAFSKLYSKYLAERGFLHLHFMQGVGLFETACY